MQMKKTHDAAMVVLQRVYGERPRFNYYFGASQGGREALTVAQRYPADYDGILADVPIVNFGMWVPNTDPAGSGLMVDRRFRGQEGAEEDAPLFTHLGILGVTGFLSEMKSINTAPPSAEISNVASRSVLEQRKE
jgi:hypothetical protein